jgi:very-short-patch-repair endonuclease
MCKNILSLYLKGELERDLRLVDLNYMHHYYKPHLKMIAKQLRNNMTETEIRLWNQLKRGQLNGLKFLRQKPLGRYIVDFYCPSNKIVIEIDGAEHLEALKVINDAERDDYLQEKLKLKVLRFNSSDVYNNIDGVITKIKEETRRQS